MRTDSKIKRAFIAAFPRTLPVFAGYCFLGMTYGIYLNKSGLPLWISLIMNLTIFSGSAEIIAVGLISGTFDPVNAFTIAFITGARYLFYGITMLDRFKGTGWKKFYMIYGMVDESFSINYQATLSPDIDKGWFMFWVTLLDHIYWVFGSVCGSLLGSLIKFNTEGLDFVMTAMFVVIFMNQLMSERKGHYQSEIIGIVSGIVCLVVFGSSNYVIPTMLTILAVLTVFRKPLEKSADIASAEKEAELAAKYSSAEGSSEKGVDEK
ncbi:MAG: branched-chain amino acid transporter AzlC [Ruminococcaceae bacterium]|nr:branched-chain amino acid transporter AzlC [Oscillospiraceae bacterium]